jgi:hypothetical protein
MKTKSLFSFRMIIPVILILLTTSSWRIWAQELELQKSFALPEENKDRALLNVSYDSQQKTFTLSYVTKMSLKVLKLESFVFDYDFNLISQEKNEYEIEKAKTLFPWFRFRGEEIVREGVGVDESDDLVLRKLEITSKYKWLTNKYKVTSKTLDKVKLRNDDGKKYYNRKYYIDENEGNAFVLAGVVSKSDKASQYKDLHILKINKDIEVIKNLSLNYKASHYLDYSYVDTDDEDRFLGWNMIFSGSDEDGSGKSSNKYTYLSVDKDLNIVDQITFEAPSGGFTIDNAYVNKDDQSVYFHGINPKGLFSLLRIADHKVTYATIATPGELEKKFQRPPSQKGGKPYKGDKFEINDCYSDQNGDFFICGQNWDKGGAMGKLGALQGGGSTTRYTDCCLFQFDNQGKIQGQYSYDTKWFVNTVPCDQYIYEGAGGNKKYWVVIPSDYLDWPWDCFIYYPLNVAAIDPQTGKIGDFLKIDNSKASDFKDLYLDWNFPLIETEKGKLVLIGKDRPKSCGKNIWLGRLRFD